MVSEEAGQHLNPPDPTASGTPYKAHLAHPAFALHPHQPLATIQSPPFPLFLQ